jgi:large repetitive protein
MIADLALVDLSRPYILKGENTDWHAVLSVILVESFETALGAEGTVIRGVARFSGDVEITFDPMNGVLRAQAANTNGHPRTQPGRREPWLDITDTRVEFAMSVPRSAGTIIANGVASIPGGDVNFAPVRAVLDAWDSIPGDAPPSDFPGTGFTLDLVLAGIVLRPPFLKPAKLEADGLLVPDPSRPDVSFTLPRIKLRLAQGSGASAVLDVSIASLGVSGIDDPGDIGAAELITMSPPYAFIGDGQVVGFGFRSATLDLADGFTPPAVLDQFGFDESWTGLYMPEIRLFLAPNGMEDFAVDAGVRNFLLGFGASAGVTGDFELMVINQGSGTLGLSARFFAADGRAIGIRKTGASSAEVSLPARSRMIIDVTGGRAPYVGQATFDGSSHNGIAHDIDLATATELTIGVTATDGSSPQKTSTLTINARREQAVQSLPPPGAVPSQPAALRTTSITLEGVAQTTPEFVLVRQDSGSVTVSLNPANPATIWTVDGASGGTASTVTIPVAAGQTKAIRATLSGATITAMSCYFRFDHPRDDDPVGFALVVDNTNSMPAVDPSGAAIWTPPATPFLDAHRAALKRITATTLTLTGTASYEGLPEKAKYNYLLARRRARAVQQILQSEASNADAAKRIPTFTLHVEPVDIGAAQPPAPWNADWQTHSAPRNAWWKANIGGFGPISLPGTVTDGDVTRPAAATPPPPVIPTRDQPPATPPPPDWFRSAALKVRIVRDQFVAVELSGSIDFETATEQRLRSGGVAQGDIPTFQGLGSQNPADGIVNFQILYQRDPASQTDALKLYLGADPNDRDGLVMTGQLAGQPLQAPSTGRNVLGMTAVFTPLLAETAPANPADGSVGEIVLSAAVLALPITLAELGFLNVERVVLYDGELDVTTRAGQWVSTLLFDVETAISADLSFGGFTLLEIPREKPLSVRYKAIGLKMGYPPGSSNRFELRPMFDSSKGYSIDLSGPGAVRVPDPIGQIIQVLGARIARTNPLTFEIDLGFAVDLGVVTIERARVRMPVDPVGPPELTAFAASINVPGTIEGRGYMEINANPFEIKGQIDVSLVPIKLRIAAGIGIANIDAAQGGPATGVIITLELQLPVAIPLANSGFGIYGFLGLFAMHYARDEEGITSLTPALVWLKDRAQGNPTNIAAWKPKVNNWAFGVGAILGTMEGGIIFNVKGMVMLELPGPRLLLIVKANLLAVLPDLKDKNAEGTFMCVVDLDFGRGTLTIGLSINFKITPLVEITIPIEAYFNFNKGGDWHVYLGTFPGNDTLGRPLPGPIHANILQVFDGQGYVMVSGHGIPSYKGLSSVSGVGLAVGLEVSITWGNQAINLYLRATAGFNAVLGFDPFYVGGKLYVRGELHLFIISISASADLTVQVGTKSDGSEVSRIDGEICGEVDLFFFSIEGCVDFHIGEPNAIIPAAPDLVRAVPLVSRTPALVVGTGVDKGIDSKIGEAVLQSAQPAGNDARLPVVPIDSIPLITMSATPVDTGLIIMGSAPGGSPGAPAGGFVKRGDFSYRYLITKVELTRADGGAAVGPGPTPATWWTLNDPSGDNLVANLSLLNWVPNATPKALERSEFLEETVKDRWGTVCHDAAPAAAVLWTFEHEPTGPSETGWIVDGIAWPDPSDTKRSITADVDLAVTERWRTGDRQLDRMRGIIPAVILAAQVPCRDPQPPVRTHGTNAATGAGVGARIEDEVAVAPTRFATRLNRELAALTSATAASVALRRTDRIDVAPIAFADTIRQLATGTAINRAALNHFGAALAEPDHPPVGFAAATNVPKRCGSRLLASPQFDIGEPIVFGDKRQADIVRKRLDKLGYKHGPLDDVIVVDSGAIVDGRILLLARRDLPTSANNGRGLVLRFLTVDGDEFDRRSVTAADLLGMVGLPPRWIDATGPWVDPVAHVLGHAAQIQAQGYVPYLIKLDKFEKLDRIEIGVPHEERSEAAKKREQIGRPYFVAAIELTRWGEATRESWDEQEIIRNRSVLEQLLGPNSGDVALLAPDELYHLRTTVQVTAKDKAGTETNGGEQTRDFWFRTDAESPKSLEPWMLCTLPAADEAHYFGQERVRIVFATDDVDKLWGAYGKELRIRLKAASFRQVDEPGLVHPVPLVHGVSDGVQPVLNAVAASVLSPFEGALVDGLADFGPCVPIDVNRPRHSAITIPIPLDPYTDYIFDIEAVAIGAPQSTVGERVLRRHFSTGAFGTFDDFAATFQAVLTEHRFASPRAMQDIFATPAFGGRDPQGPELDQAMIAAGLEPMTVPKSPRIIVFWEQANPAAIPQPVAVMIDASEPMHRTRPLPFEDSSGDTPPTKRWRMTERTWLDLVGATGGTATVTKTLWAPGRQRALVQLAPGSRGLRLRLALERKAFTEPHLDGPGATPTSFVIVDEPLAHAPWEEM